MSLPNTHKLWLLATVTLPEGEGPDGQDAFCLLTGDCTSHWPGTEILDVELLRHEPADSPDEQDVEPESPAEPPALSREEIVLLAELGLKLKASGTLQKMLDAGIGPVVETLDSVADGLR